MNEAQPRRIKLIHLLLVVGGVFLLLLVILPRQSSAPELGIDQVLQMAQSGQVARIEVRQDDLDVTTVGGDIFRSR